MSTILPISKFLPEILETLKVKNNLVLQAEPGAGKSTMLPLSLLGAGWLKGKKILMLEPRRVAATSIAHYLARKLDEKVGQRIGYQIKNERKISQNTILEIVTEGILTRRLQNDPEIPEVGLIIFDEFHERSIHADLSLMLSLEIQQSIREDLKLLVMSATIDTNLISLYMQEAAVFECPGRAFPVSVKYTNVINKNLVSNVFSTLYTVLAKGDSGDVLVFLPGQVDIKNCMIESKSFFSSSLKLLFLPLYGGLSLSDQEQVLMPNNHQKRIIFATNIAETSLTIDGVTCVIDSGLEKEVVYDPKSGMTRLETSYISKASAEQRKGRAGRTQAGKCFRLWNEQKQRSLKDYQDEEIMSADLTGTLLDLCLWGNGDYSNINWLTAPPKSHYASAQSILTTLGLIDSDNNITTLGKQASRFGVHPRLATMLLNAKSNIEKSIATELAALLTDRDIFYHNNGVDIVDRLLAVQEFKSDKKTALNTYPLKKHVVDQLLKTSSALKKIMKMDQINLKCSLAELQSSIGKLLLFAYPERLAKIRSSGRGRYKLANGKGAFLFNDDPLFGSEWIVVADCDAHRKEGRIFSAAAINYETLLDCFNDKIIERNQYTYDKYQQKITGCHLVEYGALELKASVLAKLPTEAFQKCLKDIFKTSGLEILNWNSNCENWLSRASWLGEHMNSFPPISKEILLKTLEDWLLPYISKVNSISSLKKVNVFSLMLAILTWDEQQVLEKEAPTHYKTPSNKLIPIVYEHQKEPTVSVQLQELFGEVNSPKVANGNISVRFELLSPARRPIQITSDLKHFWNNSYFDVAKEMRGRYPKHRWPELPLLEKAGQSIKTRN